MVSRTWILLAAGIGLFSSTTAKAEADDVLMARITGLATEAEAEAALGTALDGDFAMLEDELQPVLKALHRGGVHVGTIHNHMTHEELRFVFLHYWAKGKGTDLARVLKTALDTQGR